MTLNKSYTPVIALILAASCCIGLFVPRFFAFYNLIPFFAVLIPLTYVKFFQKSALELNIKPLLWFAFPLILTFVSCLWSLDPSYALERSLKLLPFFILGGFMITHTPALISYTDIKPKTLMVFVIAVLICVSLLAIEHVSDMAFYYTFIKEKRNNIYFPALNRSTVSLTILFLPSAFFAWRMHSYKVLALLVASVAVLMFYTSSQSAQLALAMSALAFLIPWHKKNLQRIVYIFIIVLLISAPFLVQYLFDHTAATLKDMPIIRYGWPANRLEIWDYVSRYALQRPFTGFGIEATRLVEEFDSEQLYQRGTNILHPHNFAMQIWIEFGVLGCVVFALMLRNIFKSLGNIQDKQIQKLGFSMLIMWLSLAATSYGLWQGWWVGLTIFSMFLFVLLNSILRNITKNTERILDDI